MVAFIVVVSLGPAENVTDSVEEFAVHEARFGVAWDIHTIELLEFSLELFLRHPVVEVDYSGAGSLEELNV